MCDIEAFVKKGSIAESERKKGREIAMPNVQMASRRLKSLTTI